MKHDFLEVKRYADGRVARFDCSLVAYDGRTVVARYVYEHDFTWQEHLLPRGGYTLAWYWRGRRYLLYRMYDGDGGRILDRFDVIDGLRLARHRVEYRDLYLDVWVDRDGAAHLDDEDELEEAESAGLVTASQAAGARGVASRLMRDYGRIIEEAERWLDSARANASLTPQLPRSPSPSITDGEGARG